MTREEAFKFWKFRYENAKDFSDTHWEAQERREHREYVEALRMAIEALSKPIVDITQRDLCADISCADCPFMKETCKLMDYVASAEAVQGEGRYEKAMQKLREMPRYLNGVKAKQINKIPTEAVQGWIPFTRRPMTEEEQKEYPNCTFMFDCVLPDDGDEILVSNRRFVWMDVFCNDIDGCYLDGGDDIDEDMAWMPLPKPYKGGDSE